MAKAGKAYSKQSIKKTGKERKEKLVAEIVKKIDASSGLVFTDYKGITHQQLENLRKELKTVDSSLLIAKNSLMRIGLGQSKNFADYKDNEALVGPAATLFIGHDSIEPLKKLQKSIKDTGLPTIKFGVLEGQLLDEAGVLKLASLSSREVLLTQFVGLLNAPIQRFVTGLNAIPQKFVMTLDAIAKAKPEVATEVQADKPATAMPSTPTPEVIQAPITEEAATVKTEETTTETQDNETSQNPQDFEEEKPAQTAKPAGEEQNVDSADIKAEETQTSEPNSRKEETEIEGGEN